ncbi:RHOMBOID-like 1 [Striga asiatica]|uniref:RHOMBOID-like protein n=1 Tax=Striga asiatica TaxID=4170 RepID=A0A5A7P738_STRAF|nr:RHOMBOID-like 1 [Striga asiatica]
MAAAPDGVSIRVHPRRGSNVIHPVSLEAPTPPAASQNAVVYREVKHFKKWFPWLIPFFVAANVVMFVITMYVNNCPKNSVSCVAAGFLGRLSLQPFKENPLLGPSSTALEKMGALDVGRVVHEHEIWRLITCIWLHGGVFHLLANMLSLLIIGIRLEQEFGFLRIGFLYLLSGFGGSLMSALFIQSNISVGASVTIIVINLAVGILPHVDNFAHIGGFLSGFLLGFVFLIRPHFGWVSQRYNSPKFKAYQRILWMLSLIGGMVLLLHGEDLNEHCSWCHYLSCVPTSMWKCNTQPVSCQVEQMRNQYTLTCSNGGKNGTFSLVSPTPEQIQELCLQLCG